MPGACVVADLGAAGAGGRPESANLADAMRAVAPDELLDAAERVVDARPRDTFWVGSDGVALVELDHILGVARGDAHPIDGAPALVDVA